MASLLQRRGIPDLFFAANGTSCWIEAKVQASCKYPRAQRQAQYNLDEAGGGPVWVLCLRPAGTTGVIWAARPEYFDSRAPVGADHHRLYLQDRLHDRTWWTKLLAGAFP